VVHRLFGSNEWLSLVTAPEDFTGHLTQAGLNIIMTAYASDSRLQKVLRTFGSTIARRPAMWLLVSFLLALCIAIPGWCTRKLLGGSRDFMTPVDMDLQWSVEGGKTERNLKIWKKRRGDTKDNDWFQKYHTTMFVGKGDKEGDDIFTHDAMLEFLELERRWTNLSVEVGNKTYTTWDICARGVLPDIPGATPILPCLTVSPLHCFREQGEVNHPSYQAIDPFIDQIIPGAVPYSTRPALVNLTDAEIKSVVSALPNPLLQGTPGQIRGCIGQYATAMFSADMWAGKLEWDADLIAKAGALRAMYFYDGPARIAYRMSISKPGDADLADIAEAQKKHSALWQGICEEHSHRNTYLEVSNMEDWRYIDEDLRKEQGKVHWGFLGAGGAMIVIFCAFVLVSWRHPMASRADVGFKGLLVVNISQVTSFGLFFLLGKYLNSPMLLAMPLLSLGLGVDDMFVLLRYFSDLGIEFIDSHSNDEILGELMARAGPGVLLTSICNSLAFGCGVFLPIPAMSDFCLLASFVAVVNFLCLTNIFLPLLAFEANRVKRRQVDPHFLTCICQRLILKRDERTESQASNGNSGGNGRRASKDATSSEGYSWHPEKQVVGWLRRSYAPLLAKPALSIAVGLLGLGGLVASSVLIANKSIGYSPADLFEKSNPNHRSVGLVFDSFALFPSYLCFYDVDIPEKQAEMLDLYKEVGSTDYAMYGVMPPYLSMLYIIMHAGVSAMYPNVTDPAMIAQLTGFDATWTDPFLAPWGTLPKDDATFYGTFFNPWRKFPEDPYAAWDPANQGFVYADLAYVNEFIDRAEYTDDDGIEKLSFSYFPFYRAGLTTEDKFVDAIKQTNKKIEASPLKDNAFIYGPIATFWEVFLELDFYVWVIFGIDAVIIFVATLLVFSFDVATAFIATASCAMIVIEIFGISCALMSFNVFVAAISLMGMGLSVEFTVHLAAAYSLAQGPRAERLGTAMAHTFPALLEGSFSTFLGILPMAFSPVPFTVKYLFGIIALVVAVGVVNGVLIMPGLIGLMSPLFDLFQNRSEDAKAQELGEENPTILTACQNPNAGKSGPVPTAST